MKTYVIASAIIKNNDKFLIAKRASTKKFAPDKWEFISGFIDTKESAEEIILRELQEELRVQGKIEFQGQPYQITDKEAQWIIIPFIINISSTKLTINPAEHSEIKWVSSDDLSNYPDLSQDIKELKKQGILK